MDFAFDDGSFDWGGDVEMPSTGYTNLGKTAIVTVGASDSELIVSAITEIAAEIKIRNTTVHSDEYWRLYEASIKRGTAVKFTFLHDGSDTIQQKLYNLKNTGNTDYFRVWMPGETKTWFFFEGIVLNVRYDLPISDIVRGTIAILPVAGISRFGA